MEFNLFSVQFTLRNSDGMLNIS